MSADTNKSFKRFHWFKQKSLSLFLSPDCDMFEDDSSLSASGNNIAAVNAKLQPSIQEVTEWCSENAMLLNPEKNQRGLPPLCLMLNSQVIEQVSEHRHLGVILHDQLKWQAHINSITNAVAKNVYLFSRLRQSSLCCFANANWTRTHFIWSITFKRTSSV